MKRLMDLLFDLMLMVTFAAIGVFFANSLLGLWQ